MKRSVYLLLVIFAFGMASVSADAGWLEDAVQGAAERMGGRAVDEASDTAYEGTKEGIRKGVDTGERRERDGADAEQTEQPAPKKKAKKSVQPGSGDLVASEEIYSKFDFIPGDKVIFFDDFSDTDVGEFPRKWTLTGPKGDWNNSVEVVDFKGKRFLRSVPAQEEFGQNGATQYIRLNSKGDLPQKFTIEFDAVLGSGQEEEMVQYFLLMTNGDSWPVSAIAETGSIQVTAEKGQSQNTETSIRMNDNKVHHLAFSVNGTFVKAYVDHVRIVNDPDGIKRPIQRVGVYMGPFGGKRLEHMMFTNFRLAEGGKSIKSALDTDGKIVTHGILFDTGSDRIRPESQPTLKMILALLEGDPALKFSIEGHTDNQGGKGVNQPLSEKRGAAVQKWLAGKGIAAARLASKGWGESKPIDSNNTVEGRANNRRVEFIKM
ncbi:MAG: hypothetical protein A2075_17655 [Geobacteraceae bacterium GWC2_58_44]|nr:MAG: hypothetical protein A2075_17655 [Geobacteraceae bacterium GWC2_58_44]HBG04339.1 hypothetical protein [Geobacter sp.]